MKIIFQFVPDVSFILPINKEVSKMHHLGTSSAKDDSPEFSWQNIFQKLIFGFVAQQLVKVGSPKQQQQRQQQKQQRLKRIDGTIEIEMKELLKSIWTFSVDWNRDLLITKTKICCSDQKL